MIETVLDANRNGVLDPGEVNASATAYVCMPAPVGNPSCDGSPDGYCESLVVGGGTFYRGIDTLYPASLSTFLLDKYEVTVGRFRKFVEAYGDGWRPASGDGGHPLIADSSWRQSWDDLLPETQAALVTNLKCSATSQTWTDAVGANEQRPINCVNWYEAFAFCAWDGGRRARAGLCRR